jgi:hypothetical protein
VEVDQPDRGWAVVAGSGVVGFLDSVGVVAGAFDDAGVCAVAASGVEIAAPGDVGLDRGA